MGAPEGRFRFASLPEIAYWLALAVVLAHGLVLRAGLPELPMLSADSWGFVGPFMNSEVGQPFRGVHSRPFVYPLLIAAVTRIGGSLASISFFQHLLGLVGGGLLGLGWYRVRQKGFVARFLHLFLGIPVVWLCLNSPEQILWEHYLVPEGLLIAAYSVLFLLSLAMFRSARSRSRLAIAVLTAVGIWWSALIYFLKPNFGFGVAGFVLVTVLVGLTERNNRRPCLQGLTVGFLLCFLTLVVPNHYFQRTDPQAKVFLPKLLVAAHLELVEPVVRELSRTEGDVGDRYGLLLEGIEHELALSAQDQGGAYESLGFHLDRFYYQSELVAQFEQRCRTMEIDLSRVYRRIFFQSVAQRPWTYVRKVKAQFGEMLKDGKPLIRGDDSPPVSAHYQRSLDILETYLTREPFDGSALARGLLESYQGVVAGLEADDHVIDVGFSERRKWLKKHSTRLFRAAVVGFVAFLGFVPLLKEAGGNRRARIAGDLLPLVGPFALAMMMVFLLALTTACFHSFVPGRYFFHLHYFVVVSIGLAAEVVVLTALSIRYLLVGRPADGA